MTDPAVSSSPEIKAQMAGSDFCWSHYANEPITEDIYLVCFECKHAFQTEQELIDAHNAILHQPLSHSVDPDWEGTVLPDVASGQEVFCCPHCVHDF